MASGTIQTGSTLYYVDDASSTSRTFTLNDGYFNLANSSPSPSSLIPSGAKIVAVGMLYWSSNSGAFSLIPYDEQQVYAVGTNGVSVSGLRCRFWYTF